MSADTAPAAMPGEMAKLVAKAMADRRMELINEPLARIWGELAATAIAAVRAHQFAHGQPAEAALAAERERPGIFFANLLQREWIGPDGFRYVPTRARGPNEVEF